MIFFVNHKLYHTLIYLNKTPQYVYQNMKSNYYQNIIYPEKTTDLLQVTEETGENH